MKYTRILLFLIFVLPFIGQPLFAQKRPLHQEDCKRWQVIREPRMSSDGRWVAYRYDHLYDTSDTLPALYLYDTRRDDTRVLFRVSDFQYFNGGKWVKIVRRGIPPSSCGCLTLREFTGIKPVFLSLTRRMLSPPSNT